MRNDICNRRPFAYGIFFQPHLEFVFDLDDELDHRQRINREVAQLGIAGDVVGICRAGLIEQGNQAGKSIELIGEIHAASVSHFRC